MKNFFTFLVFLILFAGCDGEEGLPEDSGPRYFPLQQGAYHIYIVHETRYSAGQEPVNLDYEVMTRVADSFPSAQGGYTYVIHRNKRSGEGDLWEPMDTWSVRKDQREVIVSEGNTPFVKGKFPLASDTRWNGNALNTLGVDEYGYMDLHLPIELNGMAFENTITVEQERNEDLIVFRDDRTEVYALGVGLVFKEVIQLNFCTDDRCLGQQKIDQGLEMKMEIREYGID